MKKYLANIISLSRIIMAASLFWFINNKTMFIIIYVLGWLSDAVDGTVARATNSQSELGSKIDDIGDTSLIIIMGVILIIWVKRAALFFIPFIVALIIFRLINMMITKYKYGNVYISHTYSAKVLGVLVMIMPIVYLLTDYLHVITIVLIVSILVTLEESLIHLTSEKFDSERRTIFFKKKAGSEGELNRE